MTQRLLARSRQRGLSFVGLLFVAIVAACVMVVAAQVFPTVVEYQAIVKAVNKASGGNTVAEVRAIFDRAAQIDDITSLKPMDLDITKNNDKVVVSFAYNREIHLAGPAYLVLKYSGSSR
jgi:Tfp pilus assembly major pilin PilA